MDSFIYKNSPRAIVTLLIALLFFSFVVFSSCDFQMGTSGNAAEGLTSGGSVYEEQMSEEVESNGSGEVTETVAESVSAEDSLALNEENAAASSENSTGEEVVEESVVEEAATEEIESTSPTPFSESSPQSKTQTAAAGESSEATANTTTETPVDCGDPDFSETPTDIGGNLSTTIEPSGSDYHERLDRLFIASDERALLQMDKEGTIDDIWSMGGDNEGVAIANETTDLIYVGIENPDSIVEFDFVRGIETRTFDLTPWMASSAANQGLEALTFVPANESLEGGYFLAGLQETGDIYIFELPIESSSTAETVVYLGKIDPKPGYTDIAGLDYDPVQDLVYGIYDWSNVIAAFDIQGNLYNSWTLPHSDQEGYVRNENCDIFIAQDTGRQIFYYGGLPADDPNAELVAGMTLLANRLAEAQNDDGSFDWQLADGEALTPTETGYQNVTGITALGLYDAIAILGEDSNWISLLQNSASYFDVKLDELISAPTDRSKSISCPNFSFLARYAEKYLDTTLAAEAVTGLQALLDARDEIYGDIETTRADGLFNAIIQGRASIPGIIPWDLALCTGAIIEMAAVDSGFSGDAADALDLLTSYVTNTFLPAYDADSLLTYGDISLFLPLALFAGENTVGQYDLLISELTSRSELLITESGAMTSGSENDGPSQSTAYGLMALKAIGHADEGLVGTYLLSLIDGSGRILDSATGLETFEADGEVLSALGQ